MPVKAAKDGGFAAPILINEKPREYQQPRGFCENLTSRKIYQYSRDKQPELPRVVLGWTVLS